jgi:hypothetical protein
MRYKYLILTLALIFVMVASGIVARELYSARDRTRPVAAVATPTSTFTPAPVAAISEATSPSSNAMTEQQTLSSPQGPDETARWKTCRNEKFDYKFRYPPDWRVGTIAGEEPAAISASCADSLASLFVLRDLDNPAQNEISVDVYDRGRLGIIVNSLDEYFAAHPAILKANRKIKEKSIEGEAVVWTKPYANQYNLYTFHKGLFFEFVSYDIQELLNRVLSTFMFLN